jgi:hypothetical protein
VVFYSNDLFNDKEKISVNFNEAGLDEVMRNLLRGRPLAYKIAENFIIIIKTVLMIVYRIVEFKAGAKVPYWFVNEKCHRMNGFNGKQDKNRGRTCAMNG